MSANKCVPSLLKAYATLHQVMAWQRIIPLSSADYMASGHIWIHFIPTSWQNAVHMVSTLGSCSCDRIYTAMRTMSMLSVLIARYLLPLTAPSHACTHSIVYVSSCRLGATASNDFWLALQMTSSSFVTWIVLVICAWQILTARSCNNSFLLFSSRRKLLKFVGGIGDTCHSPP